MHPLTICATPHAPDHTHTHTVPTSSASSFAPRGYLLTLTVGKVGTRRLGVADCTELVVASFVNLRVSSIKTCSVNCATAPPFQIPNGVYRQSRRHRTVSGISPLETFHLSLNHVRCVAVPEGPCDGGVRKPATLVVCYRGESRLHELAKAGCPLCPFCLAHLVPP